MKLLSVIHGPAFGGAHNQLVELAGPLQARGIETVALLPTFAREAGARIESAGVEVRFARFQRLRATADPRRQLPFLAGLRGDVRRIRENVAAVGADVVQVHGPTNPQAAMAARADGRPAVVWQLLDTRAPLPLRRATMPMVVRWADAITVWGEGLVEAHPGALRVGDRLVVVFPPVNPDRFAPAAGARDAARAELGVAAADPLVGSVGVLNPQKGHEDLLGGFVEIREQHPRAALRILGAKSPAHGPYMAELRARAERLPGGADAILRDPGSRVPELLRAFDVFVLASASRSEGMPTAILEAMLAGKPVVATDVGATRELVAEGESGLLVPPGDIRALAGAVSRLLDDPGTARRMGDEGRRIAGERFSLDRLADLHATAYHRAVAHHRATRPAG